MLRGSIGFVLVMQALPACCARRPHARWQTDRSPIPGSILCRMHSATASGVSSAVSTVRCAWRYHGRRALHRSARRSRSASTGRTGPSACPAHRANNVSSGASRNTTSAFGQPATRSRVAAISSAPPPNATTSRSVRRCIPDRRSFHLPKRRLAPLLENLRHRHPGARFHDSIRIDKVPAKALRQQRADSGLARAHKAGQEDARRMLPETRPGRSCLC